MQSGECLGTAQAGQHPSGHPGLQTRRGSLRNPCRLALRSSRDPFFLSSSASYASCCLPRAAASQTLLSTKCCHVLQLTAALLRSSHTHCGGSVSLLQSVETWQGGKCLCELPAPSAPLPCRKAAWRNPAPPRAASRAEQKISQRVKGKTPVLPKKPKPRFVLPFLIAGVSQVRGRGVSCSLPVLLMLTLMLRSPGTLGFALQLF